MSLIRAKSIEAELLTTTTTITAEDNQEKRAPKTFFQKVIFIVTNITVEPLLIFYLLPSAMALIATQNLNLEKACRVNLNFSQKICDGLSARNSSMYNETDEIVVQKLVASMYAWKNVIQSLIPAILLMFVGSWSDRHNRRKPCVIIPIFGEALASVGFLICTYYFYQLPMEYSILSEAVPPALTGGWFVLFSGIYSYISVVSTVDKRTTRIGALSTISNISLMGGTALSGIVYVKIGFYGVFLLSLSMYTMGIIYGLIMVKENKPINKETEDKEHAGFCRDFFDKKHISDTFKVALKNGERNRKMRICVIMILVMVIIGPLHGEFTVMYLFLRYRFQWNELDYSTYLTFTSVLHLVATIFSLTVFSKYLKMDDALLGVISSTSKVVAAFVFAFAPNTTIFYMGAVIEMFNSTSFIAMRSIISKLVPADELGKINSLFGVSEALMPLLYGPMYSMVYKATINVLPGTFFILGGVLTFPAILIFFWLYVEHKRDIRDLKQNEAQKEDLLKEASFIIRSKSF